MTFDAFLAVDWSGGNDRGASAKKDAIWACLARGAACDEPLYLRNRGLAEAHINTVIEATIARGQRLCIGLDFSFAYPVGFGEKLTGQSDPLAVWDWFEARVQDSATHNNRFALAGEINALFQGVGPFWGNGRPQVDVTHLPRKGRARHGHGMAEKRMVEQIATGAFTCWQLSGAGAVGGQTIMGLPMLARLRRRYGPRLSVWPFETRDTAITLVEIWPSFLTPATPEGMIKDAFQVKSVARLMMQADMQILLNAAPDIAREEGWILGMGVDGPLMDIRKTRLLPDRAT